MCVLACVNGCALHACVRAACMCPSLASLLIFGHLKLCKALMMLSRGRGFKSHVGEFFLHEFKSLPNYYFHLTVFIPLSRPFFWLTLPGMEAGGAGGSRKNGIL